MTDSKISFSIEIANTIGLEEGNQKADDLDNLTYGQSITDACINWQDTKDCLYRLAESVRDRNK